MTRRVAIALVHHPVLDAAGATVTTAITNLDIHDLSRSARTFDVTDTFIVHPIEAQRALAQRICDHWKDGSSGRRIPDRKEALARVRIVPTLEDAVLALGGPETVSVWVTAAREWVTTIPFVEARALLRRGDDGPVLIVFGTGWGLSRDVLKFADACLEPIRGATSEYNHLSVRAAVAIVLDRLLGRAE